MNIDNYPCRAERWLTRLLFFSAAVLLLATLAIFLPLSWMAAAHQWLGMGELPDRPIVGYLTRSLSAIYAFHGAIMFILATDVRRYAPIIRLAGAANIVFGFTLLGIDGFVGMPWWWTGAEGPSLIGFGVVLLWLLAKVRREQIS